MILEHWSLRPDPIDLARISAEGSRRRDKPNGFWVSVRGPHDWPAYLAEHRLAAAQWRNRVELAPDARILMIESADALLSFTREHSLPTMWDEPVPPGDAIDWDTVETDWQGIVIAPFQHMLRRDPRCRWYYGWDCASGCIWDARAICCITPEPDTGCSSQPGKNQP